MSAAAADGARGSWAAAFRQRVAQMDRMLAGAADDTMPTPAVDDDRCSLLGPQCSCPSPTCALHPLDEGTRWAP